MRNCNTPSFHNPVKYLELLLLMIVATANPLLGKSSDEKLTPYFSPAVQVGYSFTNQFFIAGQLTLGFTGGKPGYDKLKIFPGTSIGMRKYFGNDMRLESYLDLQLSYLGFTGIGVGIACKKCGNVNEWELASRLKMWGGVYGLLTYDWTKYSRMNSIHSLGIMGALPWVAPYLPGG